MTWSSIDLNGLIFPGTYSRPNIRCVTKVKCQKFATFEAFKCSTQCEPKRSAFGFHAVLSGWDQRLRFNQAVKAVARGRIDNHGLGRPVVRRRAGRTTRRGGAPSTRYWNNAIDEPSALRGGVFGHVARRAELNDHAIEGAVECVVARPPEGRIHERHELAGAFAAELSAGELEVALDRGR